jgi:hypothetical protein
VHPAQDFIPHVCDKGGRNSAHTVNTRLKKPRCAWYSEWQSGMDPRVEEIEGVQLPPTLASSVASCSASGLSGAKPLWGRATAGIQSGGPSSCLELRHSARAGAMSRHNQLILCTTLGKRLSSPCLRANRNLHQSSLIMDPGPKPVTLEDTVEDGSRKPTPLARRESTSQRSEDSQTAAE